MLIYNLILYNIVCNTNTTTNANEIKALTRVESELSSVFLCKLTSYAKLFATQYTVYVLAVRK